MGSFSMWTVGTMVCLMTASNAAGALVTRASSDFVNDAADAANSTPGNQTAHYEATAIPQNSAPAWGSTGAGDPGSYAVSDGLLSLTTTNGNHRFFTESTWGGDADRSTGYTVEFRMSVDAITDPRGPVLVRIADGTQQVELEWRSDAIVWNGTASPVAFNPSGFHTYRIAYDPAANAGAGAYAAWIDDTLVSDALTGASTTADYILFGDTGNTRYGGTTTWDYIRWDTTGAYTPIPEPTSLALLTLTAALLPTRRGRTSRR